MTARAAFLAAFFAEAHAGLRPGSGAGAALGFFLVASAFVSLALGASVALARPAAVAFIWAFALVAALFASHQAFDADAQEGVLDATCAADAPLAWWVAGKMAARWLVCVAPLAAVSPFAAFWFDLPPDAALMTALGLACASPALAALGLAGAALASGLGAAPALTGLLLLPLHAPALLFGVRAARAPGGDWTALGATLMLSAVAAAACPPFVAWVLRRAP